MSIIQKINEWFAKQKESFKTKEEKQEIVQNIPAEVVEEALTENFGNRIEECGYCSEPIETFQKRKTFNGKKYHKDCYRELYRLCRKQANI